MVLVVGVQIVECFFHFWVNVNPGVNGSVGISGVRGSSVGICGAVRISRSIRRCLQRIIAVVTVTLRRLPGLLLRLLERALVLAGLLLLLLLLFLRAPRLSFLAFEIQLRLRVDAAHAVPCHVHDIGGELLLAYMRIVCPQLGAEHRKSHNHVRVVRRALRG